MMKPKAPTKLLALDTNSQYPRISFVREIGRGRGAVANLVKIQESSGKTSLGVEKIFRAGRLTRLIYWLLYQSPFPYRSSLDAIRACYHRRRVAAALIRFVGIEVGVAAPYYTRWSEDDNSFVLGAEFIDGQGLAVDKLDPRMLRRLFFNHVLHPIASVLGRSRHREASPDSEARMLTSRMKDLEVLFRRSGLVGSGWQVCPQTLVATSNFVKTSSQYVLVDLESFDVPAAVPGQLEQNELRIIGIFGEFEHELPFLKSFGDLFGVEDGVKPAAGLNSHEPQHSRIGLESKM